MDRVILPWYYGLGASLGQLVTIPITAPADEPESQKYAIWNLANTVHGQLLWLYGVNGPLKAPQVAHDFRYVQENYSEAIGFPTPDRPPSNIPEAQARSDLIVKCLDLQAVILADLQRMLIYAVPKQGMFDTDDLIEHAEIGFPEEVRPKLDWKVIIDVRESARCLAFGVPTASGFHMMRAVEAMLFHYCQTVAIENKAKPGASLNWGDYTAYLRDSKEPDVVQTLAFLQPLKRNDRDVIAHPERVLTPNEAYSLFQEGQAAINRMADRLPPIPPSPTFSPPPPSPLPPV